MNQIIIDTREKNPWEFENAVYRKLDVGDYSLEGYESVLAIERKASTAELAQNISEKRFLDVLDRLDAVRYSFLLLEFNMEDLLGFPRNSGIPPKSWNTVRINPFFLLKTILEYQMKYKVNILFCGDRGRDVCKSIFKRIIDHV